MAKFLLRRALFLIFTLIAVSIAVFAITELAPGNIAVNTLGNTITPQQEASFNAQNGLDDPARTRYFRWLVGSIGQAETRVGRPIVRQQDPDTDRYSWWAVAEDGTLYQSAVPDGENITQYRLNPETGAVVTVDIGPVGWTTRADGLQVFWGVTRNGQAAMWVRGSDLVEYTLGFNRWNESPGAPSDYIPLQRGLLFGDPGTSLMDRRPVAEVLPRRLLNTLLLAGIAFLVVMPLAVLLGVIAGLYENTAIDRLLSTTSLVATATPEFASGVFLILIFSTWLGWFPGAVVQTSERNLFQNPAALVLPVLTLTLVELGYVLRITRASMIEVLRTNYIRTAVLKGLPRYQVVFKHALRNALLAPITVIMLHVNWLIGGIVVVESLFGYPGLGRYILDAALFKDVFAIEAAAMVLVLIAVLTQLAADLLYTYLNPRIRLS